MFTVLVTGGLGFVGSHISIQLLKKGFNVVIIDSLINSSKEIFEGLKEIFNLEVVNPNNKLLIAGYDAVWLALNMNDDEIDVLKNYIKQAHDDPNSAIYTYTQGGKAIKIMWDLSAEETTNMWENSVRNLQD